MQKKVIIIGGGIAGLTTGCYLQKNGFDTEIFESQATPGGLCTSWKRGEYIIDGCLHWLVGSSPDDPLYHLWKELIDIDQIQFHYYDEFFRVRDGSGKEIIAYTNVDRLHKELLEKVPEDKKRINEFVRAVRKLESFPMQFDKAPELATNLDKLRNGITYFPYFRLLIRYSRMRIADFAARCKSPLLQKFFHYSFASEMPMLFIMMTFSWLDRRVAGYPIGGSLEFSRLFEKTYTGLGGKIHYNARVEEILTENTGKRSRASGIRLENGQEHFTDITVSAADAHSTIFKMLDGKFADRRIHHYFDTFSVFPSFIQVSLGIGKDLRGIPSTVAFPLNETFQVDPEKQIDNLYYRVINYDPTLAPEGKTLISIMVQTYNYEYWHDLRESDYQQYKREKQRVADFIIDQLDRELGGIKDRIEMVDVCTPATVIRYTGNWKGSFEGWMVTRENGFDSLSKELPGLDDFFMAGHWVQPGGGVPAAFFSGRNLTQILVKRYGSRKFQ